VVCFLLGLIVTHILQKAFFRHALEKEWQFSLVWCTSEMVYHWTKLIKIKQTKQTSIEENDKKLENFYKCACENDEKGI